MVFFLWGGVALGDQLRRLTKETEWRKEQTKEGKKELFSFFSLSLCK